MYIHTYTRQGLRGDLPRGPRSARAAALAALRRPLIITRLYVYTNYDCYSYFYYHCYYYYYCYYCYCYYDYYYYNTLLALAPLRRTSHIIVALQ